VVEELNFEEGEGPYIERVDTIHAKIMNLSRSIGVEVRYEKLPQIESFLTNFNQLVL